MKIEDLIKLREEVGQDLPMEIIEKVIQDASFSEASELGVDYAKSNGYDSIENAPFCIDKVNASKTRIVIDDGVKQLIEAMKKSAYDQSSGKSLGDNYEAIFMLIGERNPEGIIHITDGEWDERGYEPNKYKFMDPDAYNYSYDFFTDKSNVAEASSYFSKLVDRTAEAAKGNSLVIIYGHTHPHRKGYGQINNYPSRSDISASVAEAMNYYVQENGVCTFLNAIINADGDLDVFGYDAGNEKFEIYKNIRYKSGEVVKAYTDGIYPIAKSSGTFGE